MLNDWSHESSLLGLGLLLVIKYNEDENESGKDLYQFALNILKGNAVHHSIPRVSSMINNSVISSITSP